MSFLLQDRADAGRQLASALARQHHARDAIVIAIAPGGVPVAHEIAEALHAPLDVIATRALRTRDGVQFGTIATGAARALDWSVVSGGDVSDEDIDSVCAEEQAEVERLTKRYRGDRLVPEIAGRQVILVDEGIDTGATMHAAISALRARRPTRLIVAAPVARFDVLRQLRREVDEVVCLGTPYPFEKIRRWYWLCPPVTDEEVHATLARHWTADDARAPQASFRRIRARKPCVKALENNGNGKTRKPAATVNR